MKIITDKECICEENTVCALGLFDGVHLGHKFIIENALEAKAENLMPAVFTFDVRRFCAKGRSDYLLEEKARRMMIEKMGVEYYFCADFFKIKDFTPEEFVKKILKEKLRCVKIVCGTDYRFGKGASADADDLVKLGKKYEIDALVLEKIKIDGEEVSSTAIREHLKKGEVHRANSLLGHAFGFEGVVEHGFHRGSTWDFPTINQRFPEKILVPKYGVYCSRVKINGQVFPGVTNVGVKPTVEQKVEYPLAETYIIGFKGNLYGKKVSIKLDNFLREERKFLTFESLKNQIEKDEREAEKYYRERKVDINE